MAISDKQKITLVIFDCDNILVNTDIISVSLMLDILEGYGVEMNPDRAIKLFGGKPLTNCVLMLEVVIGCRFERAFHDEIFQRLQDEITQGLEALNGAKQFLQAIACPYIMITSEDVENTKKKLLLTDLHTYFSRDSILNVHPDLYSRKVLDVIAMHGGLTENTLLLKDRAESLEGLMIKGVTVASLGNFPNCINEPLPNYVKYDEMTELLEEYCFI